MNVSIPAGETSATVWCDTTLKYIEYDTYYEDHKPAAKYRLRPHKNGTLVGAIYDLDEGVKVEWKFTYDTSSEKKVCTLNKFTLSLATII